MKRPDPAGPVRLQKLLAAAGIDSRRKCEELISSGRVEVDRQVVTELGAKADPSSQEIRLDGQPLRRRELVYYAVHKPVGYVSTNYDPAGRPRVVDLAPPRPCERLFAVGRLDMSSEGLILVTNDGELANRLAHPRYGVEKTYVVEVAGEFGHDDLTSLRKGAYLAEGFAKPASARVRTAQRKSSILEIVLKEGRNREIRRLLARQGHKALRLKRIALGPLRLGELPSGDCRRLDSKELRELREAAGARAGVRRRKRKVSGQKLRKAVGPIAVKGPTIIGGDAAEARPAVGVASRTSANGRKPLSRKPGGKPIARKPGGKPAPRKPGAKPSGRPTPRGAADEQRPSAGRAGGRLRGKQGSRR
jgi:23S rRNA pseudouridine2605 synthase